MAKYCNGCQREKNLGEFYNNKRKADGKQTQCKLCMKEQNKVNYKKHKTSWDARTKKHSKKPKSLAYRANWARNKYHTNPGHRQKCIENAVVYERKQLATNPFFKWKHYLRSRQRKWLKGKDKSSTSEKMMGCTWEEGCKYIESLFEEGMTWDNQGTAWHTDHKIPLAAFEKPEERHYATWYKNLQPMWGPENLSKSDKYKEEDKLKLINEYLNSV